MEDENEITEEVEPHFTLSEFSELYIVFDVEAKAYQAYLQLYNHEADICFVVPLQRVGTDPIKLGQIVHNELRMMITGLDSQFMQVDKNQEITTHDSVKDTSIKSFDESEATNKLTAKIKGNEVFFVIGHETLQ